jgi:hypothetical protein
MILMAGSWRIWRQWRLSTLSDNSSIALGLLFSFDYERMLFMLLCSCGSLSQNDRGAFDEMADMWNFSYSF